MHAASLMRSRMLRYCVADRGDTTELPPSVPGTVPAMRDEIASLRRKMAETPAENRADLIALVSAVQDHAWDDSVRGMLDQLKASIKRLIPEDRS